MPVIWTIQDMMSGKKGAQANPASEISTTAHPEGAKNSIPRTIISKAAATDMSVTAFDFLTALAVIILPIIMRNHMNTLESTPESTPKPLSSKYSGANAQMPISAPRYKKHCNWRDHVSGLA